MDADVREPFDSSNELIFGPDAEELEHARLVHEEIEAERGAHCDEGAVARSGSSGGPPFATKRWNILAFGVVLPVLCLVLAFPLWRSIGPHSFMGRFGTMTCAFVAFAIAGLFFSRLSGAVRSYASGLLYSSSLVAAGLGVFFSPLTLSSFVLGFCSLFTSDRSLGFSVLLLAPLGLVPFATARIYWSEATRARGQAGLQFSAASAWLAGVLFLSMFVGTQAAIDRTHERAFEAIAQGSEQEYADAVERLRRLGPFFYPVDMVLESLEQDSETAKERLQRAYCELTGEPFPTINRGYLGG